MTVTLIGGPEDLDGAEREIDPKAIKNGIFEVEYSDVPDLMPLERGKKVALGSQVFRAKYQLDKRNRALARFIEK